MQWRAHFAPVAIVELIAVARRWQTYVARAGLVLALGLTLGLVCLSYQSGVLLIGGKLTLREYAEAGTNFAVAVLSVQLALVLFAAPAGAAGAICLDKTRGNLSVSHGESENPRRRVRRRSTREPRGSAFVCAARPAAA